MIQIRELVMRLSVGGRAVTILDGVSLDVPGGQFVAVTGPSGSGKSTLLGLVAGLDQPTAGSVRLGGVDLGGLDEDQLARLRLQQVGYVPLELAGAPDAVGRAGTLLAEVGLAGRAHHYPAQLSGGEQQRVALARAFANAPAVVLADEPTGNLDSATGAQVIALLVERHRRHGTTLVLVTHDPALAEHAERVVELRDGRVVADHPTGAAVR